MGNRSSRRKVLSNRGKGTYLDVSTDQTGLGRRSWEAVCLVVKVTEVGRRRGKGGRVRLVYKAVGLQPGVLLEQRWMWRRDSGS